jgi:4-cresol dehydrogenase (hydroxylating)
MSESQPSSSDENFPGRYEIPLLTDTVITRLTAIVGSDAIVVEKAAMADKEWPLRDPYWIPGDDTYAPSVAVHPTTTEQVQAVLALANETGIPVWTHSQGRNNGYGGSSPRVGGSISISLRRMNKILEINEELAYAVVEPGVRWFDLYDELRARGSRLMLSVPDLGWGSIIGNSLDNGVSYLPYGADFMAPCGMEVVLANGEIIRTGMGAMPDNPAWHVYKRGLGPVLDPLFMQSNLGIVVNMGVWLMPQPEAYAPLTMTIANDDDLEQAIDVLRELRLKNHLRGVPCLYNTLMAARMTGIEDVIARGSHGIMPDAEIQQIAEDTGLGRWYIRTALYGDRGEVDYLIQAVTKAWEKIPGAKIKVSGIYTPDQYESIPSISDRILAGVPNLDVIKFAGEDFAHIGLSPIVPMEGKLVADAVNRIRTTIEAETGFNYKAGILVTGERACALVSAINFDPRDETEARTAFSVARQLVLEMAEMGYSEYRAHVDFMDTVADQMTFNNKAYARFVSSIKDAVDPNGILSPGRYGIWPGMNAH